jgi:hypothetical protein
LTCLQELELKWRSELNMLIKFGEENRETFRLRRLGIGTRTSVDDFEQLLGPLTSLESLDCILPGTSSGGKDNPTILYPLSPSQISNALEPTKASLTELKLDGFDQHWLSHDHSRLNLAQFQKLRSLNVPYSLLFSSPSPKPD